MLETPVLFIIFNRPQSTKLSFNEIRKAQPRQLFVAADGPRENNDDDITKCRLAREEILVDWDCDVRYLFRDINLGCGKGPSSAISWFFSHVDRGIILEDDCIPTQDFFLFCQEMLGKYESNPRIFNISGSNLGYDHNIESSYFASKIMNMWGWATWKRTAEKIDYSLSYWSNFRENRYKLFRKLRLHVFDYDFNWISFWEDKIQETLNTQNVTWWDYQWILNQLQHDSISIIPSQNLIKNIGFDNNATHTKSPDHAVAFMETSKLSWPLRHPEKLKILVKYEEQYIKKNWFYCTRLGFRKTFIICLKRAIKYLINKA